MISRNIFIVIFAFGVAAVCQNAIVRAADNDPYAQSRARMVESQLQRAIFGRKPITDPAVLEAMRKVPRHEFVPEEVRLNAYDDTPLPIGEGQTISQPYIVANMTEAINPKSGDKILEIGTGSGYQAAILAEIVDEVYTIEIVKPLGKRAAKALSKLGYDNIHTRIGDGYQGWPDAAPFDAIIVTAAPDHVPQPLIDQLKPGGRMVIPVGPRGRTQALTLLTKQDDGTIKKEVLEPVRFVPLTRDGERD